MAIIAFAALGAALSPSLVSASEQNSSVDVSLDMPTTTGQEYSLTSSTDKSQKIPFACKLGDNKNKVCAVNRMSSPTDVFDDTHKFSYVVNDKAAYQYQAGTYTGTVRYTLTANDTSYGTADQSETELSTCRNGDSNSECQVDLDANMIPVKYTGDTKAAKWTVADDSVTGDWYDYSPEKKHWANAVTVKDPAAFKNADGSYKVGIEVPNGTYDSSTKENGSDPDASTAQAQALIVKPYEASCTDATGMPTISTQYHGGTLNSSSNTNSESSISNYSSNDFTALTEPNQESETACSNDGKHAYNQQYGVYASTTTNVYGIYDMAGGAWEKVAAGTTDEDGYSSSYCMNTGPDNNGACTPVNDKSRRAKVPYVDVYEESKCFDKYPTWSVATSQHQTRDYGTYLSNNDVCTWATCGGQVLHETKRLQSVTGGVQSWGSTYSGFANGTGYNSWSGRSGQSGNGRNAGLFYTGYIGYGLGAPGTSFRARTSQ